MDKTIDKTEEAIAKRAAIKKDLHAAVRCERTINHNILALINLAEDNQCYLYDGYDDLRRWLVTEYKYSDSAAGRRVSAARMLRDVPEVSEKILSGSVNLTTLGIARRAINIQESKGEKLTPSEKANIVEQIENKSQTQAEIALVKLMPAIASDIKGDRVSVVDEDTWRLGANLSNETLEKLKRVKDLLSHTLPCGTFGQVIDRICDDWLDAKDPLRKTEKDKAQNETSEETSAKPEAAPANQTAAVKPRVNKAAEHRSVFQKAEGRCEYVSTETGRACGASAFPQKDHIIPRALGGTDEPSNYRCLCAKHNRLMAEEKLGQMRAHSWKSFDPSRDNPLH